MAHLIEIVAAIKMVAPGGDDSDDGVPGDGAQVDTMQPAKEDIRQPREHRQNDDYRNLFMQEVVKAFVVHGVLRLRQIN